MRKIIVIVLMIGIIIFVGSSFFLAKGTKIEVIKKSNNINSKQTIDAVIKEINIESNN